MSVISQGTKISITPSQIPTDYVAPVVDAFTDWELESKTIILDVPKTVADADRKTTLTNIIQDATSGIEKQVSDLLTKYDKTGNDIHFWVDLRELKSDQVPTDLNSDFLTNAQVDYKPTIKYYIKSVTP